MFKKLLISFLLATYLLTSVFVSHVKAGTWYNQSFEEWHEKVYDDDSQEIFGERYTAAQVQWVIYGLWGFLINAATNGNSEIITCFLNKEVDKCSETIENLIAQQPGSSFAEKPNQSLWKLVFNSNRGFSGISYIKEKLTNLHIVPKAEAQEGFGFGALGPIRPLWKGVRNVSYLLFILVTIVFAFMIMFRVKISPQTVITVQSALPKIAIALVLVTFSYAIAGFLVDLLYVLIGIISLLLAQAGMASSTLAYQFMVGELPLIGGGVFAYLISYTFWFTILLFASLFVSLIANPLFGTAVVIGLGPLIPILSVLGGIILLIVLLVAAFKILWMLIKTLANIYLLTIFAPLQITLGVLVPQIGFGAWLRSLASNLVVFPVVGTLFYLAFVFLFYSLPLALETILEEGLLGQLLNKLEEIFGIDMSIFPGSPWSPPLLGAGGAATPLIFVMISLVIILLIPKAADIIKSLVEGKPFAYGTAIGEAFGPAKMAATFGAAEFMNIREQAIWGAQPPGAPPRTPGWIQTGRKFLGIKA